MVMELARGGDVFDRLARRKFYTEKDARDLARSLLESIKFLHERGIAHRDIKPEVCFRMFLFLLIHNVWFGCWNLVFLVAYALFSRNTTNTC